MNAPVMIPSPDCGRITKNLGHYYIGTRDQQWCVQVLSPDGKWLAAMWPEDDEPDTERRPPSEVVEIIAERNARVWSTAREEKAASTALCRLHAAFMDRNWAMAEIKREQRDHADAHRRIAMLRDAYLSGDFE